MRAVTLRGGTCSPREHRRAAFQAEPHVFSPTRLLSVFERGARRVDRCAERKQRAPDRLKAVAADIVFV
jgi:hypothetical protein